MLPIEQKALLLSSVREYFTRKKYWEVPMNYLSYGLPVEPHISPFKTIWKDIKGKKHTTYLPPYPEPLMKKALAITQKTKVFGIGNSFRNNEDISSNHHPEFTMLEWYHVGIDYKALINEVIDFLVAITRDLTGSTVITYDKNTCDIKKTNWKFFTAEQLFKKYIGTTWYEKDFIPKLKSKGINTRNKTIDDLFQLAMMNFIEPNLPLDTPYVIYDFPAINSILCKRKNNNVAERFEVYIAGIELANGNTEPSAQEVSFLKKKFNDINTELIEKQKPIKIDYDYLEAIKKIKSPYAGVGIGLERLTMLIFDIKDIRNLFIAPL